ncbi:P-loop containing nucleoside triphosphate hydrolase protein [Hymenopellis radicata]|nr:P-loop containing nucleoside triphosphate hydrolase protein [Hymenopellis radicata]
MCATFGVPSLRDFQEQAGQNIVLGHSTILDIPTGGGKTLALWYALFYHLAGTREGDPGSDKMVVVLSPLTALMVSQEKELNERGIPAVSFTSNTEDMDRKLKVCDIDDFANNKYRVGLLGPEMADDRRWKEIVLNSPTFQNNVIQVSIDEAHSITEWGTDDFRPEYSQLVTLLRRMPSGVPVLIASATLPPEVMNDIQYKLRLTDCRVISVSNEKLNVALSVRLLQFPSNSYADLITLFPRDGVSPDDFPQTLIYVNSRKVAEEMQDFLRKHAPEWLSADRIEFYHRYVDEHHKTVIQEQIKSGESRAIPSTDALGMGMDFKHVQRVILWDEPRTFLSLVQKIGRCTRDFRKLGEAILYITKAKYNQHVLQYEADGGDESDQGGAANDEEDDDEQLVPRSDFQHLDREAAIEDDDDNTEDDPVVSRVPVPVRGGRGRKRRALNFIETRDRKFLSAFIATNGCRRVPWNEFFMNKNKLSLGISTPPGARCCDNCQPTQFPVETVSFAAATTFRPGRPPKPTPELYDAAVFSLQNWRSVIILSDFPNQRSITGKHLLSTDIIEKIASRARAITDVRMFDVNNISWAWGRANDYRYGRQIVGLLSILCERYPDPQALEREAAARERAFEELNALARQERHEKLVVLFEECYQAVESQTRTVTRGRGTNRQEKVIKRCHMFMTLPKKNQYPSYYEIIAQPISMAHIKKQMHAGVTKGYTSVEEFRNAWSLLFDNARRFNQDTSQIYEDADFLQDIVDRKLFAFTNPLT